MARNQEIYSTHWGYLNTKADKISSWEYPFNKYLSNISATVLIPEWVGMKSLLSGIMGSVEHLDEKPYELLPRVEIIFQ
jgi:hypothetical protein